MKYLVTAAALVALAGCSAKPVITDNLRGPNPIQRTRNYVRPELEDLKNRGHTYLADIKTTHRALLVVLRANRLQVKRDANWHSAGAGQIVTGFSSVPKREVIETLRLIDRNFDDVKLSKGRYSLDIGITSVAQDRTNVIIREFYQPYDPRSGRWLRQFVPPGLVTKALFKQLDRRLRVLKNTKELMWKNW